MSLVETAMKLWTDGIKVTPERYEQLKEGHEGVKKVVDLAGEALEEMGPKDDTPYVLTGGEIALRVMGKIGKLGN